MNGNLRQPPRKTLHGCYKVTRCLGRVFAVMDWESAWE
ncbi:Os08g0351250 [Oryza sativa Japonica Group]|uniref:Os08g0351250 protein n=1 Tax=Oryza sativa subsp. japonica TaxID=39947 RepID=C7J636_ORYSJ|nr:Os08g0351250 [Oryza sativa Japonica Group]|eukprot:NP_001175532.1 Os08g0351250 [Oryza sativa Japonica Group]